MKTKVLKRDLSLVKQGMGKAANAVMSTMGPEGKTVIISDNENNLKFTKDGVTVAKALRLENAEENVGAKILISSANKTVQEVGDGTTSTSVLLWTLVKLFDDEEIKSVLSHTKNLDIAVEKVCKAILRKGKKVKTTNDIRNIAKVASNSKRLGDMFKEMYDEVGMKSLIGLERSEIKDKTYYEVLKGIEFNSGYVHSAFINNKLDETVSYENAYIHVDSEPISSMTTQYEELLEQSLTNQIPLVIIAPRFSDAFIRLCAMNKSNKALPVVLIQSPGYGNGINKNYDDINSFLNADGFVDKVVVTSHNFTIYNEDTPNLGAHLDRLEALANSAQEDWDIEDYRNRYFRLKQSAAIIYAGGVTPEARDEEYDRVEDAIGAVNAAIRGGYVKGGGQTFVDCVISNPSNAEEEILNLALLGIKHAILTNAGYDPSFLEKEMDVSTGKEVNLLRAGIIDPTNVLIQALRNAVASYKLLLKTSYVIHNEYKSI